MTEPETPRSRPRWFQFDLRLLFVIIAAIGVILGLEVARAPRKTQRSLLDTLQVGDSVDVQQRDGRWTISYNSSQPYPATIIELGQDFVAVRYANGIEFFIPLNQIDGVRRRDTPTAPSTTKTKTVGSMKTLLKTDALPTRTQQ